jgi:hypothetical protein
MPVLWLTLRALGGASLLSTAAAATIPIANPPDPELLAIAVAVWKAGSPGEASAATLLWRKGSADRVAAQLTAAAYPGHWKKRDTYQLGLSLRLSTLFSREFLRLRDKALPCLADRMARTMSAADLRGTLEFVKTEPGKRFWTIMVEPEDSPCFDGPLNELSGPAVAATQTWMRNPR